MEPRRFRAVFALRAVEPEERAAVEKLAASRQAEARLVERAAMVWRCLQGEPTGAIAAELNLDVRTVSHWLGAFHAGGLAALADAPRLGRPPTYSPEERAEVVATALHRPRELDLPFGCWSLDRLTAYLHEHKHLAIQRSRVGEILSEEGLRWRKQETWFGAEKVDPDFAPKKGGHRAALHGSAREPHRALASCSAWMRWARSRPRAIRAGNPSTPLPRQGGPRAVPARRSTTDGAAKVTSSARLNPGAAKP